MVEAARYRCVRLLARFSLFFAAMSCATGCFDAPPQYSEPTLVPPVIVADKCDPPTAHLFMPATLGTQEATFKVLFRADDGDQNLKARLCLDIDLSPREQLLKEVPVTPDPRAFADQDPPREVDLPWAWRLDERSFGCHVVTAIVTDGNNFDGLVGTVNSFAAARISWYVWIQDENRPVEDVTCFDPNHAGVPQ